MRRLRVIPTLLLKGEGLYKTLRFKEPKYVGDPINTVKLLSEKEADELLVLDIEASRTGRPPAFAKIAEIAGEAFVPLGYGGGIRSVDDAARLFQCGIEKVVLNSAALDRLGLVGELARRFGSQSVVVAIDAKKQLFGGHRVYARGGSEKTEHEPRSWARRIEAAGAGELIVTSIDRDGTFSGYDLDLVRAVASAVGIPVVASGGAATIEDFAEAVTRGGAAAVAAGSMFVFQKSRAGVLISFPSQAELRTRLYERI